MSKLHQIADAFETLGLDPADPDLIWDMSSYSSPIFLWHQLSEKNGPELLASVRKLTAIFGPLKAEGEAKDVKLVGEIELAGLSFQYAIYGAYTCKITGYKDKLAPAEPAKPERTVKEPVWGCEANPLIIEEMRRLRLGDVGGGLPEKDPGSEAGYVPDYLEPK